MNTGGRPLRRLLRLDFWLVRAVIPQGVSGAYVLYIGRQPIYAGRSDTDLQRRLGRHAHNGRAQFFDYDVYPHPARAFDVECANYHALRHQLTNRVHPASPAGTSTPCVICGYGTTLQDRVRRAS